MASSEFCPRCPQPYSWNQESWLNMGCLLAMVGVVVGLVFLSLVMIFGIFFGALF
jgi:hypothetical protein